MANFPTIFTVFEAVAKTRPRSVALGYKEDDKFRTISYGKLLERVNRVVSGLRDLGVTTGTKVAILAKNRPEWVQIDLALNKIGAISVPIHNTLSPRLIEYIINNSGAEYLALGEGFAKYQEIKDRVDLKKVITLNNIDWQEGLVSFADLIKNPPDQKSSADFDICTIIYTSGTTGDPKGAMLTNNNFLSNVASSYKYITCVSKDVTLSFLPLSHVLERTASYYNMIYAGGSIFFAESPKTLADDIRKVKPTILVCVPRIFEKIYEKIMTKIRAEKPWKQKLFFWSLRISRVYLNKRFAGPNSPIRPFLRLAKLLADVLVLKKIRAIFGGRLKFAIAGGASLDQSIAKFFEALGIKILEGYGLTETSPIIAVNPYRGYRFGTVGRILPGVEVKIAEDKEILVRGENIMVGYFNNEEASLNAFTSDGWFKTGDLGFLSNDGYLTIIGRKKEMIVTSTGKNVNPVNLENALQLNKYILQAMVYGDNQKYISALIVPDFEALKNHFTEQNMDLENFELIKKPAVINLIKEEIEKQLSDFPDNEKVKDFILLDREFSEEKEELTPTLKLKRNKILEHFKDFIPPKADQPMAETL